MTSSVTAAVAQYLHDMCTGAIGAFIYGSVATGRAGPDSDIDCFVLLVESGTADEMTRLRSGFAEVQRDLGYAPDPAFPVELFTVRQCHEALNSTSVRQAIQQALNGGRVDTKLAESDEVEILRALLGTRLPVRTCPELDELTNHARSVVAPCLNPPETSAEHTALQALGVRNDD
ncbi:nucleotidyltransferase family protein [Streptomyces sp. NPDC006704]|uniref:nucleotidyltransferase family protein n=1 Tax=Streptomyces sp. NPDC006704 TaxID=3364760 RepID=UPI0036B160BC